MRLRTVITKEEGRNRLSIWFQAVRFHYVPPSFLPAILCGLIAWSNRGRIDISAFLLVVVGVTINHFGLNMIDDAFDYLHFVDQSEMKEKNPYTGGSGVITQGLLSVRQVIIGAVLCFIITIVIGCYLTVAKGWPVLAFGVFGLLNSIFYTTPPVKFGYRGFGELSLLINFGPIIGLGSYYVQTGNLAMEPLLVSLVLGCMMWSMIIINEIPDYDSDRRGHKMNLVARFGKKKGIVLYSLGLVFAYGILIIVVVLQIATPWLLIGLVSLPLAFKSIRILRRNYDDAIKMIPANLTMIKVHLYTGLALIAGYGLHLFFLNLPLK